jgi:hypothetical protein
MDVTGEVINLTECRRMGDQQVLGRLEGILAIFDAIHAGELLAALPECDFEQKQHKIALSLLGVAQRELQELCCELLK